MAIDIRREADSTHLRASADTAAVVLPAKAFEVFEQKLKSGELDLPGEGAERPMDQPLPLYYDDPAENPNAYVAVTFEDSQVHVRNGADPTGTVMRVSNEDWRQFTEDARDGGKHRKAADRRTADRQGQDVGAHNAEVQRQKQTGRPGGSSPDRPVEPR